MKAALGSIVEWLDAKILSGEECLGVTVDTVLACDLMSDLLAHPKPGALLVTGLASIQMIHALIVSDMTAAVVCRGKLPEHRVVELARDNKIALFSTRKALFEVCGALYAKGLRGIPPEEHFVHVVKTPV